MRASIVLASLTLCSLVGCAPPPAVVASPASPTSPASSSATVTVATSEAAARALVELSARLEGAWVAKLPGGKEVLESFRVLSSNSASRRVSAS